SRNPPATRVARECNSARVYQRPSNQRLGTSPTAARCASASRLRWWSPSAGMVWLRSVHVRRPNLPQHRGYRQGRSGHLPVARVAAWSPDDQAGYSRYMARLVRYACPTLAVAWLLAIMTAGGGSGLIDAGSGVVGPALLMPALLFAAATLV